MNCTIGTFCRIGTSSSIGTSGYADEEMNRIKIATNRIYRKMSTYFFKELFLLFSSLYNLKTFTILYWQIKKK